MYNQVWFSTPLHYRTPNVSEICKLLLTTKRHNTIHHSRPKRTPFFFCQSQNRRDETHNSQTIGNSEIARLYDRPPHKSEEYPTAVHLTSAPDRRSSRNVGRGSRAHRGNGDHRELGKMRSRARLYCNQIKTKHCNVCCLPFAFFFYDRQNASSVEDTNSSGPEKEFESKIVTDRSKRFDYLLQQTEIFTHFMSNTGPKAKPKAGRPKKIKDPEAGDTSASDLAEYVFNFVLRLT